VAFAAILIFMELGFLNALLESTVQLLRKLNGDLIVISTVRYALPANERFDSRRLQELKGRDGVRAVYPVYMETVTALLRPRHSRAYPIRVLGFPEHEPVFGLLPLAATAPKLLHPHTALADVASRSKYGIPTSTSQLGAYRAELSGQRIEVVGHFRLGVDFATEGNLLMTANNFAAYFPQRAPGRDPLSVVDLGVIQLMPGADLRTTQKSLQAALPDDVQILTRQELIDREREFWSTQAPVGYIFLVGASMGFIVGVIICYQVISTNISDYMDEFATLKAMGYTHTYFLRLMLFQSFYLSLIGFVPAVLLSYLCFSLLSMVTGLTMELTIGLAMLVLGTTVVMCIASGLLALRKLAVLDPADLF
jgi:putative ABC transport system permease protein